MSTQFNIPPPVILNGSSYLDFDAAYRNSILDPVLFAKYQLGVDLWDKQKEILYSIQKNRKTIAKACHSSGKTFLAACATLWWLARYPESTVITTAPTDRQVVGVLWAEIHTLLRKSKFPFPPASQQELKISSDRRAFGFTTSVDKGDEGTKFQGYHNARVLIVLDEAPGIEGKIWDAVEGLLASGDTRLLAIGNPTISSGPFFDAFGVNREGWSNYTINAFDTPNFEGVTLDSLTSMSDNELGVSKLPYLISRHWVRDRLREWGPTHPLFVSRVLGEFAAQAPDSLLSLTWLEQARNRPIQVTGKKLRAGVDVAGPGEDETVLCVMDGPSILLTKSWPQADPRGEVIQSIRELAVQLGYTLPSFDSLSSIPPAASNPNDFRNWIEFNVDSCGIGYYLALHLQDLGFITSFVNVGLPSNDRERYSNLKAELYWALRMRAESGELNGLLDDVMLAQLSGIRFKNNARGQIEIESKDAARKRGVKSPDRAEGLILAAAPSFQHGLFSYWEELAKQNQQPIEQTSDPIELSDSQKRDAGFTGKYVDGLEVNNPERLLVASSLKKMQQKVGPQQVCPTCQNSNLAQYLEGAWRCNNCGASGRKVNSKEEVRV